MAFFVCSLSGLFSNTQSRWYAFSMDESQSRVGFLPRWPGLCEACMRGLLALLWEYTCVGKLYIKKALNSLFFFVLSPPPPQTLEEPPYLTVGTDVSAKYRGAFCEAKIKTAKRLVKAKVSHISKCSWSKIKNVLSGCLVCVKWIAAGLGALVFVRRVYSQDHAAQLECTSSSWIRDGQT